MPAPLLDREFLEKLERLTIHWQKSFAGLVGGHNASRFSGAGQEFLDHRNFHHGDDLRAVNWRAYLRLEKLFLKMFQVEPRVPVRMLVDLSQSMMAYGGQKFEYARRLAAALCYVGLVRHDSMEIHGFSNRLTQRIFATGGRHRFTGVMDGIAQWEAHGATDNLAMVREFIGAYSQRGLVVVISDFLDDNGCERALQYLADFGHELMLLQVKLDFDDPARDRYTRAFDEYSSVVESMALRSGGRYAQVATTRPLEDVIFADLVRMRGIA